MMDDMAAALLWADARDIHCPSLDEGRPTLPAQFYQPTPGYADANALRGMDDASLRAGQIARTQQGINRLTLGIVPSVLAVLEALVQLIFSLSLMVLWASLPIALLFMLFQRDTGALTRLFQQGLDILKASWAGSFVLGLIFVCVEQTARLGNATAYIGFSIGSLVVTAYVASLAAGTVRQGFAAFGSVAGAATGLSLGGLGQIAGGAARVALGGAAGAAQGVAGGVGGAVQASIAGHAAMEASGSSRYARAARLGTIKPIAQLGEVAAAMGLLKDEEIRAGLYAGSRADGKGDFRAMRRQIDADQKTKLADGTTIGERATARAIAHQMRPSKRERLDDAVTRARNAAGAFADGELFQAAQDAGDRMGGKVLGAADRARATVQSAQRGIAGAARNPRRAAALDRQESVTSAAAARPDPRRTAVRLDGNRLVAAERRAPDSQGVTTETDLQAVNPSLLSARGYTWQYNTDDDDAIASVSYWKNEAPTASKGAGGPGVARMPLPRRAVARRQRDDESPLARQSREAQAQHAEVSTAAPSVLESTPEPQPRATEQARIARLQEAHAALSEQRHALAAGEAEGDADYHRMKLELREQELISDGLSDPATAGQVQTQIDIATYESRAAALNRESVVAATEAEELPPASDRATWKVQHRAQRRTARIERERTEVQQQIARRKRELGFTQATQRASAPQFRPEALRAAGELQQPDPAPKKATRS
jgi:hypothetical protein